MYKPNEIAALKGLGIKLVHFVCAIGSDEHEVRLRKGAQDLARCCARLFVLNGWSQLNGSQREGYTAESYAEEMLSHADFVVAVITENAPQSIFEVMRACELNKPVLPLFPRNPGESVAVLESYLESRKINRQPLRVGPGEIFTKPEQAGDALITELCWWARLGESHVRRLAA